MCAQSPRAMPAVPPRLPAPRTFRSATRVTKHCLRTRISTRSTTPFRTTCTSSGAFAPWRPASMCCARNRSRARPTRCSRSSNQSVPAASRAVRAADSRGCRFAVAARDRAREHARAGCDPPIRRVGALGAGVGHGGCLSPCSRNRRVACPSHGGAGSRARRDWEGTADFECRPASGSQSFGGHPGCWVYVTRDSQPPSIGIEIPVMARAASEHRK